MAIGSGEERLGQLRVRASAAQAQRLVKWAAAWPERTWAAGGADGLGHLLAQQLVAAGERVLDVQPKLGARVRLLATGASNKNDPDDALSVAVAALRSKTRRLVTADDHGGCCGCGPGGTGTWAGPRTRPRAGSTPRGASWSPAA